MRVGFRPNIARPLGGSGIAPGSGTASSAVTPLLVRMASLQQIFNGMFPGDEVKASKINGERGGLLFKIGNFRLFCMKTIVRFFDYNKDARRADSIIDAVSGVIGRGSFIEDVADPDSPGSLISNPYQWGIGLEEFHTRLEECASLASALAKKLGSKYQVLPGLIEVDYLSHVSRTGGPVVTIKYGNQYSALTIKEGRVILYNVSLNPETDQLAALINDILGFRYGAKRDADCYWGITKVQALEKIGAYFPLQGPAPLTVASIQSWLDKKFSAKFPGYKINSQQVSGIKEHGFAIKINGRFYARNDDVYSFEFKWFIHPATNSVLVNYVNKDTEKTIIQNMLSYLFPRAASFDEVTLEKLREAVYTTR
ncbi:hypothetical protein A2276_02400 [candidate division WOR-1 bacterium RIFOXYA12_FULL_43_27]|uniref:Uncharacterized protein n=1 Tax=candidate division WOR-1 bacterium RIFOXYC2_FULL_46_14 TaxID=1802587 RepID=A0A1F4U808_UNCSA|nr:MAG: hypothetical protein A2276_02400 [candidate division WOR-1 bacterium RIFOXYA12_FULL_43_27]OGC19438.1 MAG: hypothetical protein A2292_01930 [candidate division WOR-1 bacterium RIFOXYB2_FULL_46_45]OGC30427.1 MAG: hypothetical protein A2232_01930 [candidate division WOR-1 bacterium RIFOXYA2_FULL_46_56]OGC41027.1 MAG: hypothetical protein A2438_01930 [candidate division WOR-1 bacterium RIFOXYC2_FULL_46_14]